MKMNKNEVQLQMSNIFISFEESETIFKDTGPFHIMKIMTSDHNIMYQINLNDDQYEYLGNAFLIMYYELDKISSNEDICDSIVWNDTIDSLTVSATKSHPSYYNRDITETAFVLEDTIYGFGILDFPLYVNNSSMQSFEFIFSFCNEPIDWSIKTINRHRQIIGSSHIYLSAIESFELADIILRLTQ